VEVAKGVFVSNVDAEDWEPDPEVGGQWHVLVGESDSYAGMTRYLEDPGRVAWTPPIREVFLVLEGSVRIEIEGGSTLEVAVGDMVSLPAGAVTTWHVTVPYKELWVFPRTYESPG
jgi:uncharacterized cupin superfamily protein